MKSLIVYFIVFIQVIPLLLIPKQSLAFEPKASIGLMHSFTFFSEMGEQQKNIGWSFEGQVRLSRYFGSSLGLNHALLSDGDHWVYLYILADLHLGDPDATYDWFFSLGLGDSFFRDSQQSVTVILRSGINYWVLERLAVTFILSYVRPIAIGALQPTQEEFNAGNVQVGLRYDFF